MKELEDVKRYQQLLNALNNTLKSSDTNDISTILTELQTIAKTYQGSVDSNLKNIFYEELTNPLTDDRFINLIKNNRLQNK